MNFEWDDRKAATNLRKHRVPFSEAATVFGDPLAYTFSDPDSSIGESRWLTFGISTKGRLLIVSHVGRSGKVRVISARKVTSHERKIYEEG